MCSLGGGHQCFEGTYCLHLKHRIEQVGSNGICILLEIFPVRVSTETAIEDDCKVNIYTVPPNVQVLHHFKAYTLLFNDQHSFQSLLHVNYYLSS
jgi:hypothetical protein